MIAHIISAERYHLAPNIVSAFLTAYSDDAQHRYLLIGSDSLDESRYKAIFQEKNFSEYTFIYTKWNLIKELWRNRHNSILVHGENYLYLIIVACLLFGNSNMNWVCWGSASRINRSRLSRLSYRVKVFLYRRLSSIVTLMEDDRKSIISDFLVSPDVISTMPYSCGEVLNEMDKVCQIIRNEEAENHHPKTRVLLGNNPGNISYYHLLIDILNPFKGIIEVHCMLNYSLNKDMDYDRLVEHGKTVFHEDFFLDEDFYSDPEDYIHYMNSYDIYLCGNPAQTGLGALYTMLQLGKKIYITGKNYSWLKDSLKTIVYDIKEIGSYEDFVSPLTEKERDQNNDAILNYKQQSPSMWHDYLKSIGGLK